MTFKRPKARILERTVTAGNGPYTVSGAVDGSYNAFSSFMSVGDTTHLTVVEPAVAFWTGIATYSAANQITLTTVEESSGAFGAGTKEIFAGTLAARSAFFDDAAGSIVTAGTTSAYTISSFRVYDSLSRMANALIAFTPHATNANAVGTDVTLAVDGLTAKPIRMQPGVALPNGSLIAGTPYVIMYNSSDAVFYLHNMTNPYNVPLAGGLDYWGAAAPNSSFAFPSGQAISRTTYATLFALVGTTYGAGDGSTTFNLPDKRGRVSAGVDNMGGSAASRLTAASNMGAGFLNQTGGTETQTLTLGQLPTGITSVNAAQAISVASNSAIYPANQVTGSVPATGGAQALPEGGSTGNSIPSSGNNSISVTSNNTSGSAHPIVQPTIVCNYIIRVI